MADNEDPIEVITVTINPGPVSAKKLSGAAGRATNDRCVAVLILAVKTFAEMGRSGSATENRNDHK
jgi:hypothetical protein